MFQIHIEPVPITFDDAGVARVGGTRVTLQTVIAAFNRGATPEMIVEDYDALGLSDVYLILGYYLQHRGEVDAYMREQQAAADAIRAENDARHNTVGLRERLSARLAAKSKS